MRFCNIPGCCQKHLAKGLCRFHYRQLRPEERKLLVNPRFPRICSIEGCGLAHDAKGLCQKHYGLYRYQNNKDQIQIANRQQYYKHKEERDRKAVERYHTIEKFDKEYKQYRKQYGKKYRTERDYDKIYYKNNKERKIAKQIEREQTILVVKLKKNLRGRLRGALKRNTKSGSAVRDLGCSIDELKIWLEQQFQPGMTWENYGNKGWTIDHILPLSKFDLTDRKQLLKVCNWFNLRPMWAVENISKGGRV